LKGRRASATFDNASHTSPAHMTWLRIHLLSKVCLGPLGFHLLKDFRASKA